MKDSTSGLVFKMWFVQYIYWYHFNPVWIHWKQIAGQKFEE